MGLDRSQYQGLAAFRYALRQFLAFSEAATQAAGITPQQYQALLVIKTHPGGEVMVRVIAEQMLLQHNGAVQLIDRLVNAGLVERRDSPNDARSVLVVMTAKGSRLLEQLAANHIDELLKQEPLLEESLKRLRRMERNAAGAATNAGKRAGGRLARDNFAQSTRGCERPSSRSMKART